MAPRGSRRIGLEVSNSAVRIAEIAFGSGRPKLVNLGQIRLGPRAVIDGAIVDVPAVTAAIQRCVSEWDFSIKDVHLGIAGLRAITRELDMPSVPDSELDSAVRLQALDVIPFPVDKTLMSARPLEDVTSPEGVNMRRVLLAAAHRDIVDPLIEAVTAAGLTPVSIDLTSTAMIRSLFDRSTSMGGPEAIVAVGAGLTTVVVHEGGVPHFVRTIAEGGDTVTAAIAGALDLPIDDAETTKRNLDQQGPHIRAASSAANEASTSLVGEIRSSIEYYSTLPGRSEIRRVTLTGGGSRLNGLQERIQQNLRAQVVRGSALARMETPLTPDEVATRDPLVSVVVGLALPEPPGVKPLDLMPPEVLKARRAARADKVVIGVAVCVVLLFALLGVLRYLQVHSAENTVSSYMSQISTTKAAIVNLDTAHSKYLEVSNDEALLTPLVQTEADWPKIISTVEAQIPKTGKKDDGTVSTFSGTAPTTGPTTSSIAATTTSLDGTVVATVNIAIVSSSGCLTGSLNKNLKAPNCAYDFFDAWTLTLAKPTPPSLALSEWGAFTKKEGTSSVYYTVTLQVYGTVQSSRANIFSEKVPS
ncbi:MAG: type IV pilus assembly protein PilM [Acidimicrobiales bacterium]